MSAASNTSHPIVDGAVVGRQPLPAIDRRVEIRRARSRGRGDSRTSSRPARSARPGRRPRSSCCTRSSALPCSARGSPRRCTRCSSPCRPGCEIWPITYRIRSLAVTPGGSRPSTRTSSVLGLYCSSVCVARTCSTSLVPMPNAKRAERRRAWRCGCRRRRSSCPAGSAPARAR